MNPKSKLAKIFSTGAIVALGLAGCDKNSMENKQSESKIAYETIVGQPLGVAQTHDSHYHYHRHPGHEFLSIAVNVEGKRVLAQLDTYDKANTISEITALVESEIHDKDEDSIRLTGCYDYPAGKFLIRSLEVEKYRYAK